MARHGVLGGVRPPAFFAGAALVEGEVVPLAPGESAHAKVRRLSAGGAITLLDGLGATAEATLERGGSARVGRVVREVGEPARRVTVLLAAAEPARVEWALEKGTECGAARFVVFHAERSQRAHVALLSRRLERLARVVREAVKQCGRSRVPDVDGPMPLELALSRAERPALVASPHASRDVRSAAAGAPRATLVIGPEGGLAPYEVDLLSAAGAVPVTLGPRILRLETAVVTALVLALDAPS